MTDLPMSLMRARKEVLLALGSESAEDERLHRALADQFTAEAVRNIDREPDRTRRLRRNSRLALLRQGRRRLRQDRDRGQRNAGRFFRLRNVE